MADTETQFDLQGNTWESPIIDMSAKKVKAKVIEKTTVNGEEVKVGSTIEVDEITFRNLSRKGRLEAVAPTKKEKSDNSDDASK